MNQSKSVDTSIEYFLYGFLSQHNASYTIYSLQICRRLSTVLKESFARNFQRSEGVLGHVINRYPRNVF